MPIVSAEKVMPMKQSKSRTLKAEHLARVEGEGGMLGGPRGDLYVVLAVQPHEVFERDGRHYVLVDTAGIRRRSRIDQAIEKFSVIKALQAIDSAQVVIADPFEMEL